MRQTESPRDAATTSSSPRTAMSSAARAAAARCNCPSRGRNVPAPYVLFEFFNFGDHETAAAQGKDPVYEQEFRFPVDMSADFVEYLLDKGADFSLDSIEGVTLLHMCVSFNREAVLDAILASWAANNVDAKPLINLQDKMGRAPLHTAAWRGGRLPPQPRPLTHMTNI